MRLPSEMPQEYTPPEDAAESPGVVQRMIEWFSPSPEPEPEQRQPRPSAPPAVRGMGHPSVAQGRARRSTAGQKRSGVHHKMR
jgi:hypothetical protein